MIYRVVHTTRYHYDDVVSIGYNRAHLTPRDCPRQHCLRTQMDITPVPAVIGQKRTDYHGNEYVYFTLQEPHRESAIQVISDVEINPTLPPNPSNTLPWQQVRDVLRTDRSREVIDAYQFTFPSRQVPLLQDLEDYGRPSFPPGRPILEGAAELMQRIHQDFTYEPGATSIATPLLDVIKNRRGVCQDFAHLQIGCLRALGLPARYVSGYILPYSGADAQELVGAQASHAWLAVYSPGMGWVDLDPTNNKLVSAEHITLAWGREYDEVSPLRGVILGGGPQSLSVAVHITRV